ncbi:hypothetical protein [Roseobacter sp. GAI101]|uniref:hypothetical protein n=1 Tax=Roseobacter sp. (strain GAI101) TaxID=391589 RepID=UPI0001871CD4|nr:hypothetical protein [Roseobacter sp. GAI101]EEB86490.1 conserved hypothetical protein [Roseobacter sp. GAI101]
MKPNFALSLSFEGIRLLHRVSGGWRVVGELALDVDDLTGELAVLRKTAASLEPGGVRTKLLIPNDQIKYMTIPTPDLSDAARLDAARKALENATPYAVEDLAFDISSDGTQTHIAAVARETLAEAEAFAMEHRFHPVSFVAQPSPGLFTGEPFFGPTEAADTILDAGDAVDRDAEAVVVLDDLTAVEAAEIRPDPEQPPLADQTHDPVILLPADSADRKNADTAAPEATDSPPKEQVSEGPSNKGPEPDAPPSENLAPKEERPSERFQDDVVIQDGIVVQKDIVSQTTQAGDAPSKAELAEDTAAKDTAKGDTKEIASETATLAPKAAVPAVAKPVNLPRPAPVETETAATAFTSRRTAAAPTVGGATRTAPAAKATLPTAPQTTVRATPVPDSSSLRASASGPFVPPAEAKPSKLGFLSRRKPSKIEPLPPTIAVLTDTGIQVPKTTSEAEKMTVFGARKSAVVGGKPRFLGLLLTAALLVFLAGVAAWASVFMDDRVSLSRLFGARDTTVVASAPAQEADLPDVASPLTQPDIAGPALSLDSDQETVVAALDPTLSDEDGAVLDALRVPELPQPPAMPQQQVEAKYATSGIWAEAPQPPVAPAMISLDDLYLTSIDPVSTANDAIALPTLASYGGDTFDFSPASPAAAGTTFTLDGRGLVAPSPKGTLNPDGVLVFAGQPPALPPKSPTRAATTPVEAAANAALTGFRPKPRPKDLIESNERSQLDGLTRAELAGIRPKLRKASLQQVAAAAPEVTAAAASAAASLAAVPSGDANAPPSETIVNASAFAIKASLRPDIRPNNFAGIVKRAERTAPEPVEVASVASVAPRVVKPAAPSKTSVAKQATVKNAIKMRDINLIGVFGKPSSRRALIRLSNGRYQKVAVGDKLDGGRVSAIGDSELRYTRRGRDVILKMPRG